MKRIPLDAKIVAYNDAIAALTDMETDHDTADEKRARKWLADKLDKEADALADKVNERARAAVGRGGAR